MEFKRDKKILSEEVILIHRKCFPCLDHSSPQALLGKSGSDMENSKFQVPETRGVQQLRILACILGFSVRLKLRVSCVSALHHHHKTASICFPNLPVRLLEEHRISPFTSYSRAPPFYHEAGSVDSPPDLHPAFAQAQQKNPFYILIVASLYSNYLFI